MLREVHKKRKMRMCFYAEKKNGGGERFGYTETIVSKTVRYAAVAAVCYADDRFSDRFVDVVVFDRTACGCAEQKPYGDSGAYRSRDRCASEKA